MNPSVHQLAPHHLPAFITAPGDTDYFMVGVGIFLIIAVLMAGNLFLWLHTLPERMAHKAQKFQFELVAVLGLLALFTHIHLFWVAGLLLAFVDLPEIGKPLSRMADAQERLAGIAERDRDDGIPVAFDRVALVSDQDLVQNAPSGDATEIPKQHAPAGKRG